MGRLLTTFKDKTFEPSMKSYFQLFTDDTSTASQIYDSLLYVRGTNAGSLAKNQENDDDVSTVEEYDTYMPVRFYNVKSKSDGTTPASSTHTFFSVYNRAEYAGPDGQNMYDLYADYNIAKLSGASYITNSIGGAVNYGIDGGSGDDQTIPAVYGAYNWAKSQPTGSNRTVTYLMASRNRSHLNKSDATATYVYPTTSEFTQTTGDVGTLALHKFDLDYTAGNITNAYFIWADESSLPTPSGEKYFIKSNIGWPSLLSGALTNTGAVTFNSTLSVSGTATLSSNVNIGGNLVVTGTSTFNGGTITIGDAASDNVVFGADVDSHIIPDDDNTYDLGSSTQEWRNLYIDGTAYIDTLSLSTNLDLADNIAVRWGDSQDLQIFHNGTNSLIDNINGDISIRQLANDKDIRFRCDDGSGGETDYFILDGSATNMKVYKDMRFLNNVDAQFGTNGDFKLYHDSSNMYLEMVNSGAGHIIIQNANDDKDIAFKSDDGSGGIATYMTIDGGVEMTTFSKDTRHNDSVKAKFGDSGDLQMQHTGTMGIIDNQTGDLIVKVSQDDGDIIFQSDDGSGAIDTYFRIDGGQLRTEFELGTQHLDNIIANFGSSSDLKIYHNGTDSFIQNGTGDLEIMNSQDDGDIVFTSDDGSGGTTEYLRLDGGDTRIKIPDNIITTFGDGGDLQLSHDATDSLIRNYTGDLYIQNNSDDKDIIFQTDDGAGNVVTYFHCDGSLATSGFTTTKWGDQMQIALGDDRDLRLWHQSGNNFITAYTGDFYLKNENNDGDIIFQNDNGSGGLTNYIVLDGGDVSTKIETIKVLIPNLPTSDPTVAGQLWNDSGTLKISAG